MGTFDMDDILGKAVDKIIDEQLSDAFKDYGVNKNRPSVTTLEFRPVPAKMAEEIRSVKTGLFGGGTKKQLAASIENGTTTYTEVLVLAKEQFEDMPLLVKYAGTRWHFVEDGVGYKW